MNWYSEEDKLFRRYLLNDVTAEERRQIEDKLLSGDESNASIDSDEPDFVDRLLLAEEELIDDYVCGFLPERERHLFERNFVLISSRQEKLVLAREAVKFAADLEGAAAKKDKANSLIETSEANHGSATLSEPLQRGQRGWEWKRVFFVPGWKIAVYALLALAIGFWVWQAAGNQSQLERGEEALRRAYKEQRPLEARVTGLPFLPFTITRGNQQELADYRELDEADVLFRQAVRADQSSQSLHALGRLYLVKKEFDKAIDQFKLALELDQNNARLRSDLGAALLEKAKASSSSADERERVLALGASLDELNKALELDDKLLEAHFNRALVRQLMGLTEQAEQGWRDYLYRDPDSSWAKEVRQHLDQLEKKKKERAQFGDRIWRDFIAAHKSQDETQGWQAFKVARLRTGNLVTERLIGEWFKFVEAGQTAEAAEQLRILAWAGKLEQRYAGDRFTADLSAHYQKMTDSQRALTSQAQSLLRKARNAYDKNDFSGATQHFLQAQNLFETADNQCEAKYAQSWVGYSLILQAKYERSIELLSDLSGFCKHKSYKNLLANVLQANADALTGQNELSAALDVSSLSLQIAEQIDDQLCILRNQSLIASVNLVLGNYEESLTAALKAVAFATQIPADPKQVWSVYSALPNSLLALGHTMAALDAQMEAHHVAVAADWPLYKSLSFSRLGNINSQLGRHAEAIKYSEKSLGESGRLGDQSSKNIRVADSLLFQGNMLRRAGNFRAALVSYRQAIGMYARTPKSYYAYKAHEGSFLVYLVLQDETEAAKELAEVRNLLEKFRSQISEESNRNTFFDLGQQFYDAAIDFEATRRKNSRSAFQLSEESRARSLLDARQGAVQVVGNGSKTDLRLKSLFRPLSLESIQKRIPAGVQIVQYAVLPGKVIVWIVDRHKFLQVEQKFMEGDLEREANDVVRMLTTSSTSEENTKALLQSLHSILIKPIETHLDPDRPICFVPDKVLHQLPFAALISADKGQYLIESYAFILSPSATAFILCSETAASKGNRKAEQLLCLGDPRFVNREKEVLTGLDAAADEAKSVAALYPNATMLLSKAAKESAFRKLAPVAQVIHIASHAIANHRSPLSSKLLLSPDSESDAVSEVADGSLHAYELYKLNLANAKLVLLSACQTGAGRSFRGEGVINLTRPFLTAGVPVVVASLWKIESTAAKNLMVAFHEHRVKDGLRVVDAFRQAQLDILRKDRRVAPNVADWSAFSIYGGFSTY